GFGLSRNTPILLPASTSRDHRSRSAEAICSWVASESGSVGSVSAVDRNCEVSTRSGGSRSNSASTLRPHCVQLVYGLPCRAIVAGVNGQDDLVNVRTRQPRCSPMVSRAEIHCNAFESPTSTMSTLPCGSPYSQETGSADVWSTWQPRA